MISQNKIRNFCVIAHIDHGKSTLSDRFLEITKTVPKSKMKEQLLDQMDLERERGITIKLQPVCMDWQGFRLNLIDTPGHVDFTYEVSRSLAACEGAILLVDATQGIQAQTIANLYLALEQDLVIIPVINKIDLPNAEVERVQKEVMNLLGAKKQEILQVSAKEGKGVEEVLKAVIDRIPPVQGSPKADPKALIFDSTYDEYRGVVIYARLIDGQIKKGDQLRFIRKGTETEALEVGVFKPQYLAQDHLVAGEIGYIITDLKEITSCRPGDTVSLVKSKAKPLTGYKEVKPMVYAGFYPQEGSDLLKLREALERLQLNDAALVVEPEKSNALGVGFRCGFLGLLHLEVIQQRLLREFEIDLVVTVPSVAYTVFKRNKKMEIVSSPLELPSPNEVEKAAEPWMTVDIVTPVEYIGKIMELVQDKDGLYQNTEYLDSKLVMLHYQMPLASLIIDFYDKLKSASQGYASLNYDFLEERETNIRKLDILVAGERIEALSTIVYEKKAQVSARSIVKTLAKSIPRHLFEVRIQATMGYDEMTKSPGKIIASDRIPPMRKDVTKNLYGGDVTRKRKLLEKQKKGKARMRDQGKVNIPANAFLSVLKR